VQSILKTKAPREVQYLLGAFISDTPGKSIS
jgi:hypothetical protein